MNKHHVFNDEAQYFSIVQNHQLNNEIDRGSSAMIFKHTENSIYRLTVNEFTHELLIKGDSLGLKFPKLIKDFGCVAESEIEWGGFYMGAFEKCTPLNNEKYKQLNQLLDEVQEYLGCGDEAIQIAKKLVRQHKNHLYELGLNETLDFVIDFADSKGLDLDFNLSNLMLNQRNEIVVTDLIN